MFSSEWCTLRGPDPWYREFLLNMCVSMCVCVCVCEWVSVCECVSVCISEYATITFNT